MGEGAGGGSNVAATRFAEVVARPEDEIPLDEAALLIAAQARPELDVAAELHRIDALADGCREPTLDALTRHLFDDLGFRGNTEHYQDPDNSYLDQVLRRRLGIPITLSVLTIEVGRRLGVRLQGVGMPGHFLVRSEAEPALFLDPFGGGHRLDATGCRAIFSVLTGGNPAQGGRPAVGGGGSRLPWEEGYLAPVGPRVILNRMLANLQNHFLPTELRSAAWVLELRLHIPGLPVGERLRLARALGSLGRFSGAAAALERVAADLPADGAAAVAAEAQGLRARAN